MHCRNVLAVTSLCVLSLVAIGCNKGTDHTITAETEGLSSTEELAGDAEETMEASGEGHDQESVDEKPSHPEFYTVATYDKESEPTKDLELTIQRARAESKRIILQVGGDWCGWCKLITDYMHTNSAVRNHLEKHFLIMKVTYPGENAEAFLADYPECKGYPHFFVLDENGELLHSQGTGELEEGKGYDDEKFMAFLRQWTTN